MATHFFLGANSGAGFRSLFAQAVDLETARDLVILKGGPGVGKSTFLGEVGRCMEQMGTPVEYIHCAGDPDSLDGVLLPALRCGLLDGTAPHVLEPNYPAAVDRMVDLGRFYDLTMAKAARETVRELVQEGAACRRRAECCLRAARQMEREAAQTVQSQFDWRRAFRRVQGIQNRELRRQGEEAGTTDRRFLGGITCQGVLWRFESVQALCKRIYVLEDRWALAGPLLEQLHLRAAELGWNTVACCAPEEPERLEHLLIPGLGLAFVTSRPGMRYPEKPYRRFRLDAMAHPERKGSLRFMERMAGQLQQEAVFALAEAKSAHDRLEAVYRPYVDFEGVRALAALEAGRLLSWME